MSDSMKKNLEELLQELEKDDDFIALKHKYEKPNEFTIMGDKRREEWHSSFICWLLDPKQNHKLGSAPLMKFIELVNSKDAGISLDKKFIDEMKFTLEKPISKRKRIDIFGDCDQLKLVIENKIKADETVIDGTAQTDDYYEYCEKHYCNSQRCYILLKADLSTKVSNEHFISITYQELYDYVIEPLFMLCQTDTGKEDTRRVLEHYILDISNPFSMMLAFTQKELSRRIYKKHQTIIETMRNEVLEHGIDDDKSEPCKFFKQNRVYINNIILRTLSKPIIVQSYSKRPNGTELIEYLLELGYLEVGKTEFTYKFGGKTVIIMLEGNRTTYKYRVGIGEDDYDGKQEVEAFTDAYDKLREAAVAAEMTLGSVSTNPGKIVYDMVLMHTGKPETDGKTIGDVWDFLNGKTTG